MDRHLSTDMAINVFIDAFTDTPWKYGTSLQITSPKRHSETNMIHKNMIHINFPDKITNNKQKIYQGMIIDNLHIFI